MRSVGYRQAWDYLEGRVSRDGMTERAVAATRQLAKRQLTWLRATPATVFEPAMPRLEEAIGAFLGRAGLRLS